MPESVDRQDPAANNKKLRCVLSTKVEPNTIHVLKIKEGQPSTVTASKCSEIAVVQGTVLERHHRKVSKPANMYAFFVLVSIFCDTHMSLDFSISGLSSERGYAKRAFAKESSL
jgi:hypothetical protein